MKIPFKMILICSLMNVSYCNSNGFNEEPIVQNTDFPSLPVVKGEYEISFSKEENEDNQAQLSDNVDHFCPPESLQDIERSEELCGDYIQCLFHKPATTGKSNTRCISNISPIVRKIPIEDNEEEKDHVYYKVGFVIIVPKDEPESDGKKVTYEEKWLELYSIKFDKKHKKPRNAKFSLHASFFLDAERSSEFDLEETEIMNEDYKKVSLLSSPIKHKETGLIWQQFVRYDNVQCAVCGKATLFDFNFVLMRPSAATLWQDIRVRVETMINELRQVSVSVGLHYEDLDSRKEVEEPITINIVSEDEIDEVDVQQVNIVNNWWEFLIPNEGELDTILGIFVCNADCKNDAEKVLPRILPELEKTNFEGSMWKDVVKDFLEQDNIYLSEMKHSEYLDFMKKAEQVKEKPPTFWNKLYQGFVEAWKYAEENFGLFII